jgi:hypothetical protein
VAERAHHDADRRVLTAAFRGPRAIRGFPTLVAPAGPRLAIDARALRQPDAFTAVAVREAIDRHLDLDPGHSVVIVEPRNGEDFALLADLIGPLPRRTHWAGTHPAPRRERSVLLPAMRIPDRDTAELVAYWLTSVTAALRLPVTEARLSVAAAAMFADNALIHAPDTVSAPLLSICRAQEPNDLQVVMLSPGVPGAARDHTEKYLQDLTARSQRELGGLYSLYLLARRRERDITLRVAVAGARCYVRSDGSSGRIRYETYPTPVPAFVASVEIHLGSEIRPSV